MSSRVNTAPRISLGGGPVGTDAQQAPAALVVVSSSSSGCPLVITCRSAASMPGNSGVQVDFLQRPADIAAADIKVLAGGGADAPDGQLFGNDDERDFRTGDKVAEVFVGVPQIFVAVLQLLVDGGQLLVARFELLLGGLQLFVDALQLLVAGQDLFVGGPKLFQRPLLLFGQGLLKGMAGSQVLFQADHLLPAGALGRGFGFSAPGQAQPGGCETRPGSRCCSPSDGKGHHLQPHQPFAFGEPHGETVALLRLARLGRPDGSGSAAPCAGRHEPSSSGRGSPCPGRAAERARCRRGNDESADRWSTTTAAGLYLRSSSCSTSRSRMCFPAPPAQHARAGGPLLHRTSPWRNGRPGQNLGPSFIAALFLLVNTCLGVDQARTVRRTGRHSPIGRAAGSRRRPGHSGTGG